MQDRWFAPSLYDVLLVAPDATPEQIKAAYRRIAKLAHPDANPDDPHAEEAFKRVEAAYQVLSDPERRADYDRELMSGGSGQQQPPPGAHHQREQHDSGTVRPEDVLAEWEARQARQQQHAHVTHVAAETHGRRIHDLPKGVRHRRPERVVPTWKDWAWRTALAVACAALLYASVAGPDAFSGMSPVAATAPVVGAAPWAVWRYVRGRRGRYVRNDGWWPATVRRVAASAAGSVPAAAVLASAGAPPAVRVAAVVAPLAQFAWRATLPMLPQVAPYVQRPDPTMTAPWGEMLYGQLVWARVPGAGDGWPRGEAPCLVVWPDDDTGADTVEAVAGHHAEVPGALHLTVGAGRGHADAWFPASTVTLTAADIARGSHVVGPDVWTAVLHQVLDRR